MSRVSALEREGYVTRSVSTPSRNGGVGATMLRYCASTADWESTTTVTERWEPALEALNAQSNSGDGEAGGNSASSSDLLSSVDCSTFVAGTRRIVLRRKVHVMRPSSAPGGVRAGSPGHGHRALRQQEFATAFEIVLLDACESVCAFAEVAAADELLSFHRMNASAALQAPLDSRASQSEMHKLHQAWRLQSDLRCWKRSAQMMSSMRSLSVEKVDARALEAAARWESALPGPLLGALNDLFVILGEGEGVASLGLRWQQRQVASTVRTLVRLLPRAFGGGADDEKVQHGDDDDHAGIYEESSVAPSPMATRRRRWEQLTPTSQISQVHAVRLDAHLTASSFRLAAVGAALLESRPCSFHLFNNQSSRSSSYTSSGGRSRSEYASTVKEKDGEALEEVLLWMQSELTRTVKTLLYKVGRCTQAERGHFADSNSNSAREEEEVGDDTKVETQGGSASRSAAAMDAAAMAATSGGRAGVGGVLMDPRALATWLESLSTLSFSLRPLSHSHSASFSGSVSSFSSPHTCDAQELLGKLVSSLSNESAMLRTVFTAACACKGDGDSSSSSMTVDDVAELRWDPLNREKKTIQKTTKHEEAAAAAAAAVAVEWRAPMVVTGRIFEVAAIPLTASSFLDTDSVVAPLELASSKEEVVSKEVFHDEHEHEMRLDTIEPPSIRRIGLTLSRQSSRGGVPLDHGLELDLDLARARSRSLSVHTTPIAALRRGAPLGRQTSITGTGRTMLSTELHELCLHVCDVLEIPLSQAQSLLSMLDFRTDFVFEAFLREGRECLLRRAGFVKKAESTSSSSPTAAAATAAAAAVAASLPSLLPPPPPLLRSRSRSLSPTQGGRPLSPFGFECDICFEATTPAQMGALPGCAHNFCRDCWLNHMRAASAIKDFVCPACPVRMTRDDMIALGATDSVLAKFDARLLLEFSLANPHTMRCPRCACHIRLDERGNAGSNGGPSNDVECSSCSFTFCAHCLDATVSFIFHFLV